MRVLFRIVRRFVLILRGRLAAERKVIEKELDLIAAVARGGKKRSEDELRLIYRSNLRGSGREIILEDLCRRFHVASSARGMYDPPECRDSEELRRSAERDVVLYILDKIYHPITGEE